MLSGECNPVISTEGRNPSLGPGWVGEGRDAGTEGRGDNLKFETKTSPVIFRLSVTGRDNS